MEACLNSKKRMMLAKTPQAIENIAMAKLNLSWSQCRRNYMHAGIQSILKCILHEPSFVSEREVLDCVHSDALRAASRTAAYGESSPELRRRIQDQWPVASIVIVKATLPVPCHSWAMLLHCMCTHAHSRVQTHVFGHEYTDMRV